jgi:LPS-assembly protein
MSLSGINKFLMGNYSQESADSAILSRTGMIILRNSDEPLSMTMKKYFILLAGMLLYKASWAVNSGQKMRDAEMLGWISGNNVCGGHFGDPPIPGGDKPLPPLKTTPLTISANNAELKYTGMSNLSGNVELTQPGRIVTSHEASLTTDQGDYKTANFKGQVTIRETGRVAVGQEAELDLKNKWYRLKDVIYRLFVGNNLSGWGSASQVTEPPSGITELKNITYSTCPPQSRAWHLTADQLDLDQDKGRGHAKGAVLYAQGIPVFYAPFLNFPIDNRRQSGFLYPQFSFGNQTGFGLGIPYYWNIASNMDDTVTPAIFAKRGFQLNNQYRYLTKTSNGIFKINFLPNDPEFRRFQKTEPLNLPDAPGIEDLVRANPTRSFVSLTHQTQFNRDWSAGINYNRVSDDYYIQDLGSVPVIAQNQLLQQGQVNYTGDYFNFLGNLQAFQTLHPVNQPLVLNQYNMLPQLLFTSRFQPKANVLNYQWLAEMVNFTAARTPGVATTPPSGKRYNFLPSVSLPLSDAIGYVEPKLGMEMTQYSLGDQPMGFHNEITRTLPIFDIDSGLYLERETHLFSHDYTQTLEPRVFYLYVPYHNQREIPVFDSSLQPFSYNQLFLTNRFSGSDRIGDANQVSIGLSSRFLDNDTGNEKFSAGAGIIKYFRSRRVTLCQTLGCSDSPYAVGSILPTSPVSPVVGQASYHFNPAWSTTVNASWDTRSSQIQNSMLNFQYSPLPNHIFNLGYNYIRHGDVFTLPNDINSPPSPTDGRFNLSQPTTSFAWPLNDQWNVLGSFGYSLNQHHPLTYFSGVEYNSCCWAVQVVMARQFTAFDAFGMPQYNTGVYVQWAFKGLAKVAANDPTSLILSNIPGYQDNFNAL